MMREGQLFEMPIRHLRNLERAKMEVFVGLIFKKIKNGLDCTRINIHRLALLELWRWYLVSYI